jgi:hypothetical protein
MRNNVFKSVSSASETVSYFFGRYWFDWFNISIDFSVFIFLYLLSELIFTYTNGMFAI